MIDLNNYTAEEEMDMDFEVSYNNNPEDDRFDFTIGLL
jgi:hypothetical protein